MPDLEISNLPSLEEASVQATDPLPIADLSASETKKVTVKDLIEAGVALIDSASIPAVKVGTLGTNQVATAAIQNLAVTTAKIADGAVTVLKIADATITGAKLVNDTVTATQIAANAIGASELADNAVDTAAIANNAITNVKINNGEIVYAKLNISDGDIPGAKITGNSITSAQIGVNAVGSSELADNSVDTAAIVNAAVTGAKIATDTIGSGNIAANAVGASELADNAVDTAAIASNAVTTAKIADDQVTTAKLADNLPGTILATGAIGSTQIAANAVTDSELANNAVDAGAIASNAVTEAKIAANAVTTTKISDGTITPAKLNTSNLDRSINVASGNLGINNTVTAATRSGITYNAQGLITGTVALAASDLPLATASAVGGISVGTGLSVTGAGALSLTNSVTGATISGITFNNQGMITAATALVAGDLPVATTSAKGAVQITSGGGLTVDGSGNLSTSTSGISAGTYGKLTVNNKGIATAGTALTASDIPNLDATKITTGSIAAARIGNDSIDGTKLSNTSTAIFQSIAQLGYPTAQFSGQILFDTVSEDAFIWDGNAWQAITTLTKGSLVFGGTFNANTSKMVSTTTAGIAAGLAVGSNLPSPSANTDGVYVVVDTAGTPSAPAPVVAFSPPDYILGVTNTSGSSWNEVDLSQTVAGQIAGNITFTPYGQLSATNVQDALQELETEKMGLAGGTCTGQLLIANTGSIVFEGATVDAYELTLAVADPQSSDKTITFPDITGTLITTGDTNTVTSTMVNGSLVNANLAANAAIAFSKLAALSSAQILVGNGSNVPTAVAVTGDIGINNAGLTSITAGAIVNADISNSAAITGSKVTTGTTSAVVVLQLTDSAASTSTSTAATPAAVKVAKDAADAAATTANAALPKAGGTMTGHLVIDNGKELRLSESDSDGANYTGLKVQAQSGDITLTLPAVAPTANQVLKADASTPTTLTWATDAATDSTKMPLAGGTFTGDVTFTGDSSDGLWDKSASVFVANLTGNVTGNASTATALASSVNIGGVAFDGSASINLPGVNASGTQDTSGTAALATSFTVTANNSTDETVYLLFADGATGSQGAETDTGLTYNPSTGLLTSTGFSGVGTSLTALNATNLSSGTVAAARLGSGSSVTTKFLRGDNTWQTISATPEGTAILSTGESGGTKFLREDGDGTCSWQSVPAGVSLSGSTNNTIPTVTGANALNGRANLTFDGATLTIDGNSGGGEKIALTGISEPRINYYENTTLKAHLIWQATAGEFFIQNVEHQNILSVGSTLRWSTNNGGSFTTILDQSNLAGNVGSGGLLASTNVYVNEIHGNGSNLTALNASNLGSGTVATARLGSGTASSSNFLRGDGSWQTVTSTTINNNANNRVITGSGTANTLEGESTFTYDGDAITLGGTGTTKIILENATGPAIDFRESTTPKALVQWQTAGYMEVWNREDGSCLRIKDDLSFSTDRGGGTFYSVLTSNSNLDGSKISSGTIAAARVATLNQNTTGTSGGFTAGSASNLNSGTLPDARFPSTLPAVSGANLTNLPAAAPQITATASGSIAVKDPLIINSSGQATKIVKTTSQQTPAVSGSPSVIQSSSGSNGSCIMYVSSIDRWFCAYHRNSYIYGKMGRSLSGNAITWGSEIAISGYQGSHPQCCFDLSANVPVFVWKNNSNTTPYCRPMGINTSTDTMSHGTQFQIGTNASNDINIVYDPSAQRCVMAWTQSNDISAVTKYIDVSSATSATVYPSATGYGTYLTGSTSYPDCRSDHLGLCYDPDQQACIAFIERTAGTHNGKTGVVQITTPSSGSSASTVTSVYHWIPANSYVPTSFACDYDEKENRVVTAYTNSATSYANIQIAVGQWNGSLYGMGTNHGNSVNTTNHAIATTYDPTAERVVVAWGETSGPKIRGFTIGGSGYTVTESSIGELDDGSDALPPGKTGSRTALAYHATSGGCLMIFKDEGNSDYYSTKFVTSAIPTTNLNTGNFAGFANNSIGSGGSVTINVVGATTSWTASSLTPGTGYYVQADGTLGTSADALSGSVSAGLALTSSSLLIK